jgi:hypothetical protein
VPKGWLKVAYGVTFWSNLALICSSTGIGFLLDTVFYYRIKQIHAIYTHWWISLADISLHKINEITLKSLLRLDHMVLEPRLFSLNAFVGIAIFSWILGWLSLTGTHGNHTLHEYYATAWGIAVVLFPFLLVIVTLTRWIIRRAVRFNSPFATGMIGICLGSFVVAVSLIGYWVGGGVLPYIPLWAYRNGFDTNEQTFILTFFYNLFRGIGNVLIYVSLIPFYYYLFVIALIFFLHILAKLFERHLASEVDSGNSKVFTSGGFLIGALANLTILVFVPLLNLTVMGIGELEGRAGLQSAMNTAAYLGKVITNPKEKVAMEAFAAAYLHYVSTPHSPEQVWADGAKGNAIIYKHFMGHAPPKEN